MAKAVVRLGATCTVLCTNVGLSDARIKEMDGVEVLAVPTLLERFLMPIISTKRIDQLVARADAIHVMGHWSLLGARVCFSAQRQGKPYVYSPAGSLGIFGRSAFIKRLFNWLFGRRAVMGATTCLAVTELELDQFRAFGIPQRKLQVLPNGVHVADALVPQPNAFRQQHGLEGTTVVLFLGRLSLIKGPDLLLDAFYQVAQKIPSVALVLAGPDDGMRTELEATAARYGISDRVRFIGFIGGQQKQDALAGADLLVVPSRHEAMSLVALEAGLMSTPVLLTDQCGFDQVADVDGGAVVAAEASAIAQGICQLLRSPSELEARGARLRELVVSTYSWDRLVERLLDHYRQLKPLG